jgi:HlyD family secretion protein
VSRRPLRWFTALVAPLATVGLVAVVARAYVAPSATDPRPADIEAAERTSIPAGGVDERMSAPEGEWIGGNGVVEPRGREVSVAGDASGRIVAMHVVEGDRIAKGAKLVELEHAVETAALDAAQADVDAARAELSRTLRGNRREDVRAAEAEAESARARAELSAGVLERLESVVAKGGATIDEVERARNQAAADEASVRQSEARRDASVRGSRREDVQAARARLAAAEARRDQAAATLATRFVVASSAGEVLQSKFRVGEYYQAGGAEPLFVVGDTTALHVRVDVDERDIANVRLGAKAIVRVPALPGRDLPGTVVEIGRRMGRKNIRTDDPVERNDTKILEVVVALSEPDGLVVGQRGMVYIDAG